MSNIKASSHQVGLNADPTKNITLQADASGNLVVYSGTPDTTLVQIATILKSAPSTFTGTGSQTAFTLSVSSATNSAWVFQNGLMLTPTTDYTISGTTLTFTTAPASGDEILVRY